MKQFDRILTGIARKHLDMQTLDTRRSDSLDFHTVAAWQVRSALKAAFNAGVRSAQRRPLTNKALRAIDLDGLLAKRRQVAIVWCIEDVQQQRPDLNDAQAWEVLQECRGRHDCDIGFNWELVDIVAEDLYPSDDNV